MDIHPFEKSNLGKPPYRIQRVYSGSTYCDYCSTPIKNVYELKSGDGKTFKVGCDCILKSSANYPQLLREVRAAKRAFTTKQRQAKRQAEYKVRMEKLALEQAAVINSGTMPFGKYRGQEISTIPASYHVYLYGTMKDLENKNPMQEAYIAAVEDIVEPIIRKADVLKKVSEWYGEVGFKLVCNVVVEKIHTIDTRFGSFRFISFRDKDGRVFVTFYNGADTFEQGETLTIKATIKDHKEYNGEKQTQITRIKRVKA